VIVPFFKCLDSLKIAKLCGFNPVSAFSQKYSAHCSGKAVRRVSKSFPHARMVQTSSITLLSMVELRLHAKKVCVLYIALLNGKLCEHSLPLSCLKSEIILIPLDRGKFVDVHPCSTLSVCR